MTAIPYAILNASGQCVNISLWDGVSIWQLPSGFTAVPNLLGEYTIHSDGLPTEPVAQWVQFAGMLAANPAVNQLVAAAATMAPVLHLMLGVGLGQAAEGNPATFLAAWAQARAGGLVSELVAGQVAAMAAAFDLPPAFVAGLAPETR